MPVDKLGHTDGTTVEGVVSGEITLSQVSGTFLRRDGGNAATGNLNLNENSVVELRDSASSQIAATKNYVGSQIVAYVNTTMLGPTISVTNTTTQGINMKVFKQVLFSTIVFDIDSKFNIALSRFALGETGYYAVS